MASDDDLYDDDLMYDDQSEGCDGMYDDEDDLSMFQDPGGRSALRASSARNPRNLPCPTCRRPNMLTPADRRLGYQCDRCADAAEGRGF